MLQMLGLVGPQRKKRRKTIILIDKATKQMHAKRLVHVKTFRMYFLSYPHQTGALAWKKIIMDFFYCVGRRLTYGINTEDMQACLHVLQIDLIQERGRRHVVVIGR